GNPQNMLCGALGHLDYRGFLWHLAPVALLGLAINHAVLHLLYRKELASARFEARDDTPPARPPVFPLAVIAATALAYTAGTHLAWTAAAGFTVLLFSRRAEARDIWPRIDATILLFFTGLFVAVAGLEKSGAPAWFFQRFPLGDAATLTSGLRLSGLFLVGSNVVSNVPFILVVKDQLAGASNPRLAWELLAMASTFAGNLTLLGSVANVIVAESARDAGGLGFREHLRAGAPIGLLTTLAGALWLLLVSR
ncbi:MAG: SLC13 family permease, partial [Polyangiaceae bacterium]